MSTTPTQVAPTSGSGKAGVTPLTASTTVITNMTTVIANGPNGATQGLANAASGYIMDYVGNTNILLLKMQEIAILLTQVIAVTDASDGANLTLLTNISQTFV